MSLEIDFFLLKMIVKSGLDFFYFDIQRAPSEIPANLPGQFSLTGQIFLHWAAASLQGLGEYKKKVLHIFFRQLLAHLYNKKKLDIYTRYNIAIV